MVQDFWYTSNVKQSRSMYNSGASRTIDFLEICFLSYVCSTYVLELILSIGTDIGFDDRCIRILHLHVRRSYFIASPLAILNQSLAR
jgi:hypothetical protein